ncbi:hypothetical protein FSP39_014569 [Pinctada imbricata]|uniref:Innexin n=1 Tax=Pinctada imbricata TaxID=66713 RepID=A0AA88Y3U5_PINIB|nr:hypothetical protein FSP39_014569 [Pinctada imbricata]
MQDLLFVALLSFVTSSNGRSVNRGDPEVHMNATAMINLYGYPVENHYVQTADGYILNMQRIPYGLRSPPSNTTKPVVVLQHGLLAGSDCYLMNLPKSSIGFLLADNGYDVWLTNSRGNVYCMKHKTLDPSSDAFWNFSYDEMAAYDLPASIDYILNQTKVEKVAYVGHSQGTMIAFARLSTSLDLQDKVNVFIALAPVAKVYHIRGLLGFIGKVLNEQLAYDIFGHKSYGQNSTASEWVTGTFCALNQAEHLKVCNSVASLIMGFDVKHANFSRAAVYLTHVMEGTSTKNMIHFAQGVKHDKFQMYDYGSSRENMKHYNQSTPPDYPVQNINIPVALFTGPNDLLADPADVSYLTSSLPNIVQHKEKGEDLQQDSVAVPHQNTKMHYLRHQRMRNTNTREDGIRGLNTTYYTNQQDRRKKIVTLEDVTERALSKVQFKATRDDTFFHQLNRIYCVVLFIIFAIFSGSNQYIKEPITCWCPKEFKSFHVNYANTYCWIKNTYNVPFDMSIPADYDEREESEIHYYQWVPLIFTFQAIMFILPRVFWKLWHGYTGLNITRVINMAENATIGPPNLLKEQLRALVIFLMRWIEYRDASLDISQFKAVSKMQSVAAKIGLHNGNFMSLAYIFTSLLYFLSCVGQFLLLDNLLSLNFRYIGHDYFNSFSDSKPWMDLKRFPRAVLCDFDIRQLANLQRWTVQCTLPINIFNEKMFLAVWFILIIMAVINFLNFVYTLVMFCIPCTKFSYIAKHLISGPSALDFREDPTVKKHVEKFVNRYLRNDGVFILWIITQNSSRTIAREVIEDLWKQYCRKKDIEEYPDLET